MVQFSSSPQLPQNVTVVLQISTGSFADGFPVLLQILEDGQLIQEHDDLPAIPAAPEMPQLYREWQEISLEGSRQLQAVSGQVTNVSYADWRQRTTNLRDYCRTWFRHTAFCHLRDRILANARVRSDQSVPIIIKCFTKSNNTTSNETTSNENDILRRLPWHLWSLFSQSQLPNAEFALFTGFHRRVDIFKAPIRVLAIFGSSDGGLQLEQDEAALKLLEQRGAEITRKSEPSGETLSRLLFDENWDILFFAGHSSSQGNSSGTIQISQGNSLPLDALRRSLTRAVTRGLKLAIFNSCDGLGIADFLTELNVPVVIVMREPVPDRIAGQFLLYLLREFSQGTPLFLAVREARDRLESLEFIDFPAASWLPVICVNPNQPELVWPAPSPEPTPPPPPPPPLWRRLLSNLRDFITRFLVWPAPSLLSRLRSCFGRYHLIVLGFAAFALVLIFAVGRPIACQKFPSICQQQITNDPISGGKKPIVKNIDNFISYGKKPIADSKVILNKQLKEPYLSLKKQGIDAFAQDNYKSALTIFNQLRQKAKENKKDRGRTKEDALAALQDPEVLIYRNNAVVRNRQQNNPNLPIYTIAVAAPLNIDAGMGIFFGVAQAQDVAVNNEKGINLQVVIANDNNSPAQARQIAEKLYSNNEILAVVGHYTSENTCAALNVYSQKLNPLDPLVIISPTSSVVGLPSKTNCGGDTNKVFFRTVSSTRVEAESLVKYLIEERRLSMPKVVVFYNSKELFSKDLFERFKTVLEGEAYQGLVIHDFDLSDAKFDIKKLPQKDINAVEEADALAVFPDGQTKDPTAFNKAINIITWNNGKKPILGANTLYLQDVLELRPQTTTKDSLFIAIDWHPTQCGAKDFAGQINEYWGGDLNRRTALAYEAVQAVLKAIELSNSSVDRKNIQNKLSDTAILNPQALRKVAALSDTIKNFENKPTLPISFELNGDRRETTTQAIVTVKFEKNKPPRFVLVQDVPCPN